MHCYNKCDAMLCITLKSREINMNQNKNRKRMSNSNSNANAARQQQLEQNSFQYAILLHNLKVFTNNKIGGKYHDEKCNQINGSFEPLALYSVRENRNRNRNREIIYCAKYCV